MSETLRRLAPLVVLAGSLGMTACNGDTNAPNAAEITNTTISPEADRIATGERQELSNYLEDVIPVYEQLYTDLSDQAALRPDEISAYSTEEEGNYTFRKVALNPVGASEALSVSQWVDQNGEITSTSVTTFIPGIDGANSVVLQQVNIRNHDNVDLLNHVTTMHDGQQFALGQAAESPYSNATLNEMTDFINSFTDHVTEIANTQPISGHEYYNDLLVDQMQNIAWAEFHTNSVGGTIEKTFSDPEPGNPSYSVKLVDKDTGESVTWWVQLDEDDDIYGPDFRNALGIEMEHVIPATQGKDGVLPAAVHRLKLERTTNGDPEGALEYFFIGTIDDPSQEVTNFDSREGGLGASMVVLKGANDFRANG